MDPSASDEAEPLKEQTRSAQVWLNAAMGASLPLPPPPPPQASRESPWARCAGRAETEALSQLPSWQTSTLSSPPPPPPPPPASQAPRESPCARCAGRAEAETLSEWP